MDEHTPSLNSTNPELEKLQELLPAYGMGITDDDDTNLVRSLLAKYPEEATALTDYEALGDALLYSVPQVTPPADLGQRLMRAAADTGRSAPATLTNEQPLQQPLSPTNIDADRVLMPRFAMAVLSIAAVLVLIALNLYLLAQVIDIQNEQDALQSQSSAQVALLNQFAEGEIATFPVAGGRDDEGNVRTEYENIHGVILCHPEEKIGVLRVSNLPPLAEDQVYQLWLVHDETRISGGLLKPDANGFAEHVFYTPLPMQAYQYIGMTPEPASGSDGPTSRPVMQGALYVQEH